MFFLASHNATPTPTPTPTPTVLNDCFQFIRQVWVFTAPLGIKWIHEEMWSRKSLLLSDQIQAQQMPVKTCKPELRCKILMNERSESDESYERYCLTRMRSKSSLQNIHSYFRKVYNTLQRWETHTQITHMSEKEETHLLHSGPEPWVCCACWTPSLELSSSHPPES